MHLIVSLMSESAQVRGWWIVGDAVTEAEWEVIE
jgi:hypothetical protein